MTADQIMSEIRALTTTTAAPTREPVTLAGWYENVDGTVSKCHISQGRQHVVVDATVRSFSDVDRYEELCRQGASL